MKKLRVWILALILVFMASPSFAASGIYGATCRTGGSACVDGIDVADPKGDSSNIGLAAGDMCFVVMDAGTTQPELYIYRLYSSSTAENDPIVIKPDYTGGGAYNGALRWHLVTPVGAGIGSAAVDGQNRIYINNNTSRTPAASANELYPVGNVWHVAQNGTDVGTNTYTVASGALALATSSISSGQCQTVTQGSVNSAAATGVATTDVVQFTPNGSIKAVTGYVPASTGGLTIAAYPTSGYVNFDVCNWTSGAITPGAVTINWRVSR